MFDEALDRVGTIDRLVFGRHAKDDIAILASVEEQKYLLLEIELKEGGRSSSAFYLRGFENDYGGHRAIATAMLTQLTDVFAGLIDETPLSWQKPKGWDSMCDPVVVFGKDGLEVKVTVHGGGKYMVDDDVLKIYGSSKDFGSLDWRTHGEMLRDMIGSVLRLPAYSSVKRIEYRD